MQAAREALGALPGETAAPAAPRKGASGDLAASSARRSPLLALVFPGGADAEADGRAASQEALVRVLAGLGLLYVVAPPCWRWCSRATPMHRRTGVPPAKRPWCGS